ncbi:hypothetical protein [Streptomyces sp. NPDC006285]|uniref:hypothetical protein n=1 Tax=Streptomyces sp. NPDC006285 TaxID=3364742 RepID=UPI0036B5002A
MRAHDLLSGLWKPVDWMLSRKPMRETAVVVPSALLVIYIVQRDGLHVLLTEGWSWVTGCGIATFGLIRWLQSLRGIETANSSSSNGR